MNWTVYSSGASLQWKGLRWQVFAEIWPDARHVVLEEQLTEEALRTRLDSPPGFAEPLLAASALPSFLGDRRAVRRGAESAHGAT